MQLRDVSTRRQHFLIPYSSYRWKGRLRENRVECARRNTQALCPFPSSLLHFTAQKNTIICQICSLRVLYTRWATVKKEAGAGNLNSRCEAQEAFQSSSIPKVHHPSGALRPRCRKSQLDLDLVVPSGGGPGTPCPRGNSFSGTSSPGLLTLGQSSLGNEACMGSSL